MFNTNETMYEEVMEEEVGLKCQAQDMGVVIWQTLFSLEKLIC